MSIITIADLSNAKLDVDHIADIATSTANTATDRIGGVKKTMAGASADIVAKTAIVENAKNKAINTDIPALVNTVQGAVTDAGATQRALIQSQANNLFVGIGYAPPVIYISGLNITSANQTVDYTGNTYAPVFSQLPFTTSGTFETAKFRLIQGITGSDLASGAGISAIKIGAADSFAAVAVNLVRSTINRHAFEDWSALNTTDTNLGYCSFDAQPVMTNSLVQNHFVGYQSRPIIQGSGGINSYFHGYNVSLQHFGTGVVASAVGMSISDVAGTGPVTENIGIFIADMVRGSTGNNWAIYSTGGKVHFGGQMELSKAGVNHSIHENCAWAWTSSGDPNGVVRGGIYADAAGNLNLWGGSNPALSALGMGPLGVTVNGAISVSGAMTASAKTTLAGDVELTGTTNRYLRDGTAWVWTAGGIAGGAVRGGMYADAGGSMNIWGGPNIASTLLVSPVGVTVNGTLNSSGAFAVNGATPRASATVNAAATDLASVIALCNQLRAALVANGIAV